MLLFSLVFTTKTIPHSGSPYKRGSSQLLSISVSMAETDPLLNKKRLQDFCGKKCPKISP
jgi:hypothetical protein